MELFTDHNIKDIGMLLIGHARAKAAFSPLFSATTENWDAGTGTLRLNSGTVMTTDNISNNPTVVGNALVMTESQSITMPYTDNLVGHALVITAKVTGTATTASALLGFGKTGTDYFTIQSRTTGSFYCRQRSRSGGVNTTGDPRKAAGIYNFLNELVTIIIRFTTEGTILTINNDTLGLLTTLPAHMDVDTFTIGAREPGTDGASIELYRIDVLEDYTPEQIALIAGQHAASYGTMIGIETAAVGRKLVVMGDSIASGIASTGNDDGYMQLIRNDMLSYEFWSSNQEGAFAGAQMSSFNGSGAMNATQIDLCFDKLTTSTSLTVNPVEDGATFFNDAISLLVGYGANDYKRDVPIGTLNSIDTDTFCGAFNVGVSRLYEKNPAMVMGFGGIFYQQDENVANGAGHTLQDYRDALNSLCGLWDIPVADFITGSPANAGNVLTYTSDGLHPLDNLHQWGYGKMVEMVESGLRVPSAERVTLLQGV